MYRHHEDTIKKLVEAKKDDPEIIGILLGGSLAHGYATEVSDVDVMFVVEEATYQRRMQEGNMTYYSQEHSDYDQGYVDGKYVSIDFIRKVANHGSEPARFAFGDSKILYSEDNSLGEIIAKTGRYPIEDKDKNIERFYAQFEAYYWYCGEAIKHKNEYLLMRSVSNLVLFGGRLILADNEVLYPYHKWFLRVLGDVKNKPEGLIEVIEQTLRLKNQDSIDKFCELIKSHRSWHDEGFNWTSIFVKDSELNWLDGLTPVADL